jgi:hypothetical protein
MNALAATPVEEAAGTSQVGAVGAIRPRAYGGGGDRGWKRSRAAVEVRRGAVVRRQGNLDVLVGQARRSTWTISRGTSAASISSRNSRRPFGRPPGFADMPGGKGRPLGAQTRCSEGARRAG